MSELLIISRKNPFRCHLSRRFYLPWGKFLHSTVAKMCATKPKRGKVRRSERATSRRNTDGALLGKLDNIAQLVGFAGKLQVLLAAQARRGADSLLNGKVMHILWYGNAEARQICKLCSRSCKCNFPLAKRASAGICWILAAFMSVSYVGPHQQWRGRDAEAYLCILKSSKHIYAFPLAYCIDRKTDLGMEHHEVLICFSAKYAK